MFAFLFIIFSFSFSNANQCPSLQGEYVCPKHDNIAEFELSVNQSDKGEKTLYTYQIHYTASDNYTFLAYIASDNGVKNIDQNGHDNILRCYNNRLFNCYYSAYVGCRSFQQIGSDGSIEFNQFENGFYQYTTTLLCKKKQ